MGLIMLKIILPIPSSSLATNKSKGKKWQTGYDMRKNARESGHWLAIQALQHYDGVFTPNVWLKLTIVAYFKNDRRLDDDNFTSALKPWRDGIFDGLKSKYGLDDRQIGLSLLNTMGRDKINPRVEWFLEELKHNDI
jgi:hypothetical protein